MITKQNKKNIAVKRNEVNLTMSDIRLKQRSVETNDPYVPPHIESTRFGSDGIEKRRRAPSAHPHRSCELSDL